MKILNVSHKSKDYEFRLLEQSRVIEVTKAGRFHYLMKWSVSLFVCDCPGAVFHKQCWHTDMIRLLKQQQSITEPWAEWAEEAGRIRYERSIK